VFLNINLKIRIHNRRTDKWMGRQMGWSLYYSPNPAKNTTLGCGEYNTVIPICKKHLDKYFTHCQQTTVLINIRVHIVIIDLSLKTHVTSVLLFIAW